MGSREADAGAQTESAIRCEECRRPWRDPGETWRMYLTDDAPAVPVSYCPGCAEREFGSP